MSRAERTEHIVSRVLPAIERHQDFCQQQKQRRPFILGLTSLQGCGKSTLATDIVEALNKRHHCCAVEVSLDDLYLTHTEHQDLQKTNSEKPVNKLLKVRGQPVTHDISLARETLAQFAGIERDANSTITLPIFDKSLFNGDGDRLPEDQWRQLKLDPPIQILVFEGWCVGFRSLSDEEVEAKRGKAKAVAKGSQKDQKKGVEQDFSNSTLADHELGDLQVVNSCLKDYCAEFMGPKYFDFLIHLDTNDLVNVYR